MEKKTDDTSISSARTTNVDASREVDEARTGGTTKRDKDSLQENNEDEEKEDTDIEYIMHTYPNGNARHNR